MPNSDNSACKQFDVAQRRVHEPGRYVPLAQLSQRRIEHRVLPVPISPVITTKTVVVHEGETHVRRGARMLGRHKQEFRVRRQVERATGQLKEIVVHFLSIPELSSDAPLLAQREFSITGTGPIDVTWSISGPRTSAHIPHIIRIGKTPSVPAGQVILVTQPRLHLLPLAVAVVIAATAIPTELRRLSGGMAMSGLRTLHKTCCATFRPATGHAAYGTGGRLKSRSRWFYAAARDTRFANAQRTNLPRQQWSVTPLRYFRA